MPAALAAIVTKEGPWALLAGVVPRVAYVGPSCAIFFAVYERVHALPALRQGTGATPT